MSDERERRQLALLADARRRLDEARVARMQLDEITERHMRGIRGGATDAEIDALLASDDDVEEAHITAIGDRMRAAERSAQDLIRRALPTRTPIRPCVVSARAVHRTVRIPRSRSRRTRTVTVAAKATSTGDPDSSSDPEPPGDRAWLRAVVADSVAARSIGGAL